jgi:hypothetical protein
MQPQLQYVILVLPTLFALTLMGDGINKVIHEENVGIINICVGVIFIGAVIYGYFYLWTLKI